MKLVSIFGKNLFASKYTGNAKNEFRRLFDLWTDPEELDEFFEKNKKDITNGFYGTIPIEDAIFKTIKDAVEFEEKFKNLEKKRADEQLETLSTLFEPLHEPNEKLIALEQSKSKSSWLRLYGLKVDNDVFIITGGAIKLTRSMQYRKHTNKELKKIRSVRDYLIGKNIIKKEDIVTQIEI